MDTLKIYYEDKHIVVCEKPPHLLSQSDTKGAPNMISALSEQLNITPKAVHRLDKGVSGVMVYAKTDVAAARLSQYIQNGLFKKEYLAVVCGVPSEPFGTYTDLLFKDSAKNKTYVVDRMRKGVKEAHLDYKVIESRQNEDQALSLVHIRLHTGRTHQIRVQFSSRKTAVYGDARYGGRHTGNSLALHSHVVCFPHPVSKKEMRFESMPCKDFPWSLFVN